MPILSATPPPYGRSVGALLQPERPHVVLLPYAGASAVAYRTLQVELDRIGVSSTAIDLPGHGARLSEKPLDTIPGMAERIADEIPQVLLKARFALFGHSMGAILAYRMALLLESRGYLPERLIVSGRVAPSVPRRRRHIHALDREEFYHELRLIGGMPDEVLNQRELMALIEPILRADFRATETYVHEEGTPLAVPLTVIVGDEENIEQSDLDPWRNVTTGDVRFERVPGGHFYPTERPKETARSLAADLPRTSFIRTAIA